MTEPQRMWMKRAVWWVEKWDGYFYFNEPGIREIGLECLDHGWIVRVTDVDDPKVSDRDRFRVAPAGRVALQGALQ